MSDSKNKRGLKPAKLAAECSARELLRRWVDRATYETEYDGRMYNCCIGCDNMEQEEGQYKGKIKHDNECLFTAAQKLIEDTGPAFRTVKPRGKQVNNRQGATA
jgi:hypothetical protein